MTALDRLIAIGLPPDQAETLAAADFDVLGVVPLGWVGLPFDEHLARIGGVR